MNIAGLTYVRAGKVLVNLTLTSDVNNGAPSDRGHTEVGGLVLNGFRCQLTCYYWRETAGCIVQNAHTVAAFLQACT